MNICFEKHAERKIAANERAICTNHDGVFVGMEVKTTHRK